MLNKIFSLLFLISTSTSFGAEVPEGLRGFLKGTKDITYKGESLDGGYPCGVRFFENDRGFFIEGYREDANGEVNREYDYARITLDADHELYEYTDDSFGIEAEIRYFSPLGESFDTRAYFRSAKYGEERELFVHFQRKGFWFFKTIYKATCILKS